MDQTNTCHVPDFSEIMCVCIYLETHNIIMFFPPCMVVVDNIST